MTAAAYQNELETQFSSLPGFLQSVLREPFDWIDGTLKDIAGSPDQLLSAGDAYAALGRQVAQLGTEQAQDRRNILSGAWEGQAYEAFSAQMDQVEQRIASLGQATGQTQQLLDAAAQACAQSADAIVSIVEGTIAMALQSAVVAGLASLVTFGGAAAADAAFIVAKFADACEEIGGVVARLATVLEKIANMLARLVPVCQKVEKYMTDLRDALEEAKGLKGWFGKGAIPKAQAAGINTAVRAAVGGGLVGSPFPGIAGGTARAGLDGYHAVKDVQQAEEQR